MTSASIAQRVPYPGQQNISMEIPSQKGPQMLWQHERYPILRVSTKEFRPTTFRTQKGCGDSMRERQIPGVKTLRRGQYDRSGLAPAGRGMVDPTVKVVSV